MGKRTDQITVDGRTYTTTQYPATRGFKLLLKLSKLLAPSLQGFSGVNGLLDMDVDQVLGPILDRLDADESISMVNEIFQTTEVIENGKNRPINFDLDFAGNYLHLFKTLGAVLRFQYSDFLGGAASKGPGAVVPDRVKALQ